MSWLGVESAYPRAVLLESAPGDVLAALDDPTDVGLLERALVLEGGTDTIVRPMMRKLSMRSADYRLLAPREPLDWDLPGGLHRGGLILTHARARPALTILGRANPDRLREVHDAVAALTGPGLGDDVEAWHISLSPLGDFTGTLAELLGTARAVAGCREWAW